MNRSIVFRLMLKDLYFARWLVIGTLLGGVASLALVTRGQVAFFVGCVSLLCLLIILNVFVVTGSLATEQREKIHLFVLSLPVSTAQYIQSKILFGMAAFILPWLLLTAGAAFVIHVSPLPNGFIPFSVTVLTFIFTYFCVFVAVALVFRSNAWNIAVIITGNVGINFLIPALLRLPSVAGHTEAPTATWGTDLSAVLIAEVAIGLLALWAGYHFASRKRDFL